MVIAICLSCISGNHHGPREGPCKCECQGGYQSPEQRIAALEAENARLQEELEQAQYANRTRDDYPFRCQNCGRAHILDTSIPSEIWNQIMPNGGMLCTTCIDDRLVTAGLTAKAKFYFVGTALQSQLYQDDLEWLLEEARAEAVRLREKAQVLHDAIDELNADGGDPTYCTLCTSVEYDGTGIVHSKDCPLDAIRPLLAAPSPAVEAVERRSALIEQWARTAIEMGHRMPRDSTWAHELLDALYQLDGALSASRAASGEE